MKSSTSTQNSCAAIGAEVVPGDDKEKIKLHEKNSKNEGTMFTKVEVADMNKKATVIAERSRSITGFSIDKVITHLYIHFNNETDLQMKTYYLKKYLEYEIVQRTVTPDFTGGENEIIVKMSQERETSIFGSISSTVNATIPDDEVPEKYTKHIYDIKGVKFVNYIESVAVRYGILYQVFIPHIKKLKYRLKENSDGSTTYEFKLIDQMLKAEFRFKHAYEFVLQKPFDPSSLYVKKTEVRNIRAKHFQVDGIIYRIELYAGNNESFIVSVECEDDGASDSAFSNALMKISNGSVIPQLDATSNQLLWLGSNKRKQ